MSTDLTTGTWRELARRRKLDFVFQQFRPQGKGLAELFEDVVGCSEIIPRLLEVYDSTASGYMSNGIEDAYFIVRHPPTLSENRIEDLTLRHLTSMSQLISSDKCKVLFDPAPKVEVIDTPLDESPDQESLLTRLFDAVNDVIFAMTPVESDFLLLDEAFYHVACDYFLRHYLLWPLYRPVAPIADPFDAYFTLWKHGLSMTWDEPGFVRVHVPAPPRVGS